MINFLHSFNPSPVLVDFTFVKIYYYGLFIVLAIILALLVSGFLANRYKINKDDFFDLSFYLIIFGVIGARIYDCFLEWRYYLENPWDVFKIWQGGLSIHGGILAGILVFCFFIKRRKIRGLSGDNFWLDFFSLSFIITPGLALAQAVGRWGNYFNQELFGKPSDLPWSIPINILNRPVEYIFNDFFHPTFLYESLGSFFIFILLISAHFYFLKKRKGEINFRIKFFLSIAYLILYSVLRFFLEFIRIDFATMFLGLRFPQAMSLLIVFVCIFLIFRFKYKKLI